MNRILTQSTYQFTLCIAYLLFGIFTCHAKDGTTALESSSLIAVAAATQEETYVAAIQKLDALLVDLEPARGTLDRSQFDVDALVLEHNYDAVALINFVKSDIAFQQYPGLMRGAIGTLVSRSGNALDQAMLLASIFELIGYEFHVAHGELSPKQANGLLAQMRSGGPDYSAPADIDAYNAIISRVAGNHNIDKETAARMMISPAAPTEYDAGGLKLAAQTKALILKTLADEGMAIDSGGAHERLQSEALDYYWLRYRATPADDWADVHPAYTDNGPGAVIVRDTLEKGVPAGLKHRVSLQVFAEVVDGKTRDVVAVTEPWEEDVYRLIGQPLSVGIAPFDAGNARDIIELDPDKLGEIKGFKVGINGVEADGKHSFDLYGRVPFVPEGGDGGAEELGQSIGGAFGGLSGGKKKHKAAQPKTRLSALWVDYQLTSPAGTINQRRMLIDLMGAPAREAGAVKIATDLSSGQIAARLISQRVSMLNVGPLAPAFVADGIIGRIYDTREVYAAMLEEIANPLVDPLYREDLNWGGTNPLPHFTLFATIQNNPNRSSDVIDYRPTAGLIELNEYPYVERTGDGIATYIDIIANSQLSLTRNGNRLVLDADASVGSGVWETLAEQGIRVPGDGDFNTFVAFAEAQAQGLSLLVLDGEMRDQAVSWHLSDAARAQVVADLAAGNIVVVPDGMLDGRALTGWWRIDPRTGTTLGMTSDGRGQATLEYTIKQAQNAHDLYGQISEVIEISEDLRQCQEQHGGLEDFGELFCCVANVYDGRVGDFVGGHGESAGVPGLATSMFAGMFRVTGQAMGIESCF